MYKYISARPFVLRRTYRSFGKRKAHMRLVSTMQSAHGPRAHIIAPAHDSFAQHTHMLKVSSLWANVQSV